MGRTVTTRRIGLSRPTALREEWYVVVEVDGAREEHRIVCDEGRCLAALRELGIDPINQTFERQLLSKGE